MLQYNISSKTTAVYAHKVT